MNLYELFWGAIRGEVLSDFIFFIEQSKGNCNLQDRFDKAGYAFALNGKELKNIPIQVRFLIFVEEFVSALINELLSIEPFIPSECAEFETFIYERKKLVEDLNRDLIQEKMEYNMSEEDIYKADLLIKIYLLLVKGLLTMCNKQ